MVRGEPGVGKSTLVDAFLAGSRRASSGVGQCLGHRGPGEPYMPVLEALGELARGPAGDDGRRHARPARADVARRAAVAARRRPGRRGASATRAQGATRARMLREMLEALDAIGATAPVALVLEDLHWADDSTLDLLAALLRRRDPARLLVLGTYRPVGPRASRRSPRSSTTSACAGCARSCRSRGSPADAVAAYLRGALPGRAAARTSSPPCSPSAPAATRCSCATCSTTGWPTGRSSSAGGAVGSRARARRWRPASRRRCARTSATSSTASPADGRGGAGRRERRRAATSPPTRSPPRSDRDRDAVEARCAALAQRTPLIERRDGGHAFPHDLHREVLYELLPPDARARLHARVGAHLADAYGPAAAEHGRRARLPLHGRPRPRARASASCASRPSARSAATPTPRASATCAPRSTPPPRWPPARSARAPRSSCSPRSARRSWRPAAGRRPRPRTSLLRARDLAARLSDNEPLVSVLLALATLYELRGEFGRAHDDGGRVPAARAERAGRARARVVRAARLQPVPPGLVRARARVRRARRGAVRGGGAPGRLLDASPRRSATTPASPATTGPGSRCGSSAAPTRRSRARRTRSSSRATRAARTASPPRGRRWPSCTSAGASPRPRWSGRRRRSPGAQQLGYVYREAMGRVLRGWALALLGDPGAGHPRDHRRAGGVARDGRADGRPALPRAARRGVPARGRRRGRPGRGRRGARARAPRAVAVLRARAAAPRRRAARGRAATPSAAEACAAPRARPRARAGLGDARAADRHRPRAAAPRPGRAPPRRAPPSPRRTRGFTEGFGTRDLREAAALLEARVGGLRRSRRRRPARARARRARRGRRRTPPWSGAPASAAGTRSRRSRRRTRAAWRGSSAPAPAPSSSPILRSSNAPESTTAGTESRNE